MDTSAQHLQQRLRRIASEKATVEDFNARNVVNVFDRTNWAIITAENPGSKELSYEENLERTYQLKRLLESDQYHYLQCFGRYGDESNESLGFIVIGIDHDDAVWIGCNFGQESVITHKGLTFCEGGAVIPPKGVIVHSITNRPATNYTYIPGVSVFAFEF